MPVAADPVEPDLLGEDLVVDILAIERDALLGVELLAGDRPVLPRLLDMGV